MALLSTEDKMKWHLHSPQRITDVQARILWAMREDESYQISEDSRGGFGWGGWHCGFMSPWGEVPLKVSAATGRSLLNMRLIGPRQQVADVALVDDGKAADRTVVPVDFRKGRRPKGGIAQQLHTIAGMIAGDMVENEPSAFVLVLTGPKGHEIVHRGHATFRQLHEACRAAGAYYYSGDGKAAFYGSGNPYLTITEAGRASLLHKEEWDAIKKADETLPPREAWIERDRIHQRFRPKWKELGR